MIDIDEITQKLIEEKNNLIINAFVVQIGELLMDNGIVPIVREYTKSDIDVIADADKYNIIMKFGVTFDELDTSKHDQKIYNQALKDYKDALVKSETVSKAVIRRIEQQLRK